MNNAVYWAMVEEALPPGGGRPLPVRLEIEYRGGLDEGTEAHLAVLDDRLWVLDGAGTVAASAVRR